MNKLLNKDSSVPFIPLNLAQEHLLGIVTTE